ncbi:GNAT family N-acetyltransferase [bacterium Unc6]|nr:GNAT family N-acetyltransferase [bacterium Unc6]
MSVLKNYNSEAIRKPRIREVKQIHSLINSYAKQGLMLPRSLSELYESIRDFWVAVKNKKVVGCVALHIFWDNLAEIKCLAVFSSCQKQGIGTELVEKCLEDAKYFGVKDVFTLTYRPEFFKRFGFKRIQKEKLPHKIWIDCMRCPEFPKCNEVALIWTGG